LRLSSVRCRSVTQLTADSGYSWMEAELTKRKESFLYRELQKHDKIGCSPLAPSGMPCLRDEFDQREDFVFDLAENDADKWLSIRGEKLFNLSSNNYLGLSGDLRLVQAASDAAMRLGAGATASRLVSGNHVCYSELEEELARWKGREAALVFANGYMANLGVISALVGRGDAVFSDRLNHASIVDGIILSRADHYRYRHNDMDHLESLLKKHSGSKRRMLIVADAVFSMDGDSAPLRELVELRDRYHALLLVDEAHSGGVRGERGEGLCHEYGLHGRVDVIMGTFSKAFGVYGAYVCADEVLIRYLVNTARPLIYSTGLPPMVVASVQASLQIVQEEGWRRERLRRLGRWFRDQLRQAGLSVMEGDSPIVPWLIGSNDRALRISRALAERGISAVAIRPPTVPEGEARIRFSLMATHAKTELAGVLEQIREVAYAEQEAYR